MSGYRFNCGNGREVNLHRFLSHFIKTNYYTIYSRFEYNNKCQII